VRDRPRCRRCSPRSAAARPSPSAARPQNLGFSYDSLDFEAAFTIDIHGRQGHRSVRPHFQTVRVPAIVASDESEERLRAVVE
jgi:hypothetical protein